MALAREGKEWAEKEDAYIFKKLREGKESAEFCVALKRKAESVQERVVELLTNMNEEKSVDDIATELGIDRAKVCEILGVEEADDDAAGDAAEVGADVDELPEAEGEEADGEEAAPEAKPAPAAATGSARTKAEAKPAATPVKPTTPAKAEVKPAATPAKESTPAVTPAKETPKKEVPSGPEVTGDIRTDNQKLIAIMTECRDLLRKLVEKK